MSAVSMPTTLGPVSGERVGRKHQLVLGADAQNCPPRPRRPWTRSASLRDGAAAWPAPAASASGSRHCRRPHSATRRASRPGARPRTAPSSALVVSETVSSTPGAKPGDRAGRRVGRRRSAVPPRAAVRARRPGRVRRARRRRMPLPLAGRPTPVTRSHRPPVPRRRRRAPPPAPNRSGSTTSCLIVHPRSPTWARTRVPGGARYRPSVRTTSRFLNVTGPSASSSMVAAYSAVRGSAEFFIATS